MSVLRERMNAVLSSKNNELRKCKLGEYSDTLSGDDLAAFSEMMDSPSLSPLSISNILGGIFRVSPYTVRSHRLGLCICSK